jgi:hypothetical protein
VSLQSCCLCASVLISRSKHSTLLQRLRHAPLQQTPTASTIISFHCLSWLRPSLLIIYTTSPAPVLPNLLLFIPSNPLSNCLNAAAVSPVTSVLYNSLFNTFLLVVVAWAGVPGTALAMTAAWTLPVSVCQVTTRREAREWEG